MSAHISEARATITQALDGVLLGLGKKRFVICELNTDRAELLSLYSKAVKYMESKLGKPTYSGQGPSYPNVSAAVDPGVLLDDYSHSIELSWWKTEQGVYAALVSGHDADTLHCLTVEFVRHRHSADA